MSIKRLSALALIAITTTFWIDRAQSATTVVVPTNTGSVVIGRDTIQPGDLTMVLQDFNGTEANHISLRNNTGRPAPEFVRIDNGYAVYSVSPSYDEQTSTYYWNGSPNHDPQITFRSQPYSVHTYDYVRTRQSYQDVNGEALAVAPRSEMWPNTPVGPTQVTFGTLGTNFQEYRLPWRDVHNPSIITSTEGGFRWDPVVGSLTTQQAVHFNLDYFMIDRGRVLGYEFDSVGTDVSGWSRTHIGPMATELNAFGDSVLKGTTTDRDPFISRSGLNLDTSIYQFVEVRLKTDLTTTLQFFWTTDVAGNTTPTESKSVKISTTDSEFHTYLLDFSNETTWSGNLASFRIDLGSTAGMDFEVDYIRFREIGSVVPEPSLASLMAGGAMLCLLSRRRTRR